MTEQEYAGWLADKIPAYGDYAREAATVIVRQAARIAELEAELRLARQGAEHCFQQMKAADANAVIQVEARRIVEAELAALRKQEPVATVRKREPYEDGTPNPNNELVWVGRNCENDLAPGTKLYTAPTIPEDPQDKELATLKSQVSTSYQQEARMRNVLLAVSNLLKSEGIEEPAIPEGWQLVPKSSEWFLQFVREWDQFKHATTAWKEKFYKALLSAAPKP